MTKTTQKLPGNENPKPVSAASPKPLPTFAGNKPAHRPLQDCPWSRKQKIARPRKQKTSRQLNCQRPSSFCFRLRALRHPPSDYCCTCVCVPRLRRRDRRERVRQRRHAPSSLSCTAPGGTKHRESTPSTPVRTDLGSMVSNSARLMSLQRISPSEVSVKRASD